MKHAIAASLVLAAAGLVAALGVAAAEEPCGLCDDRVVTNADLATCFLDEYPALAAAKDSAIVVDLSACATSRGVFEALPMPKLAGEELDVTFMVSQAQLVCLKRKLEEPGLVLDPQATIELDSCG